MSRSQRILISLSAVSIILFGLLWWKLLPPKVSNGTFANLPGWQQANLQPSFAAFQNSCKAFLRQPKNKQVGTDIFPVTVADFQVPCRVAKHIDAHDNNAIKQFFEAKFQPVYFKQSRPVQGLFTGYYLPQLKGSWTKSERYRFPIFGKPNDLISVDLGLFDSKLKGRKVIGRIAGHQLLPYHTREIINQGKSKKSLVPILWVDNRVDRFFLEIQGSGYIDMPDGKTLMLGYAAQNGQPYTPIGRYLIAQGIMTKQNASMQRIRQYLEQHPEKIDEVLHQNPSFVFFDILKQGQALGAQGIPLTAGYSLAVDRHYIPLGVPIWLDSSFPTQVKGHRGTKQQQLKRLMIAQDTGGAIKGRVRGDVFWGGGQQASFVAGHMKNPGQYWILLPKKDQVL